MWRVRSALALAAGAWMVAGAPLARAGEWSMPPAGYAFAPVAGCLEDPVRAERPARPGAATYRVCADQMQLFAQALGEARASGKLLLVTFGATWCSSCAVLQRKIKTADILGHAPEAIDFAARFHHVEIGVSTTEKGRKTAIPSGEAVLDLVLRQTPAVKMRAIPFLAVIDPERAERVFARNLDDLETRDGFEPARVRTVLVEANAAITSGAAAAAEPGWVMRKLLRWWRS